MPLNQHVKRPGSVARQCLLFSLPYPSSSTLVLSDTLSLLCLSFSLLGYLFWLPVFLILCYLTLPWFILLLRAFSWLFLQWLLAIPFSIPLKLAGSLLPLGHGALAPFFLPCLCCMPFDFPSKCMGSEFRLGTQNHSLHFLALKGVMVEAGEPLPGFSSHPLSSQGLSKAPTNRGRLGLELSWVRPRLQNSTASGTPRACSLIWKQAPLPHMIHEAQ